MTYGCRLICEIAIVLALGAAGAVAQKKTAGVPMKQTMPSQEDYAVIETSLGTFEARLYPSDAPKTVENFVQLAKRKFFDGLRIHRVARGFVIQTGDEKSRDPRRFLEWGSGGKSFYGKEFADELNPNTPSYKEGYRKGVLAMANHGPNTNSSQFFIMLTDNASMPKNYTIFGKVVKGLDVVDRIGAVEIIPSSFGSVSDGRPKEDVLIMKVTVMRKEKPAPAK